MSPETFSADLVAATESPCWLALAARLHAGHETRARMRDEATGANSLHRVAGSFHRQSALALRRNECGLDDINLEVSDVGKADSYSQGLAAGNKSPAGRG